MRAKLLYILFFCALNCFSQTEIRNKSYEFKNSYSPTKLVEDKITKDVTNSFEIKNGAKVEVTYYSEKDNIVEFKYWTYKDTNLKKSFNGDSNEKFFKLPLDFFIQNTNKLYKRYKGVDVGIYSIPFRFRDFGNKETFDFETSLSLQGNVVFGFGTRYSDKSWLDLSVGLGLTGVNLDSKNSNVTQNRTASATTFSTGFILKPADYANIGFFFGIDMLGQKDIETNWIYNRKIWYGIGINIGFNRISTNKSPKPNSQE